MKDPSSFTTKHEETSLLFPELLAYTGTSFYCSTYNFQKFFLILYLLQVSFVVANPA